MEYCRMHASESRLGNDITKSYIASFAQEYSGGSSEDEQQKPFWRQSNKEFLAEMKEKVAEKSKKFKNSKTEIGESSKTPLYHKNTKDKQVWVVKKAEEKIGDESGSTKPEEPQVVKEISVDDDIPSQKFEKIKKEVGRIEISNKFYQEEKDFDVEKAFSGNVKKMFVKMLSGKTKGVKDLYAIKKATYSPTEQELKDTKSEMTWREVCFPK
ncbi:hypothetical protein Hdeb2414_s0019g00543211 [Helianthus debilis subsp. tardiflorus]